MFQPRTKDNMARLQYKEVLFGAFMATGLVFRSALPLARPGTSYIVGHVPPLKIEPAGFNLALFDACRCRNLQVAITNLELVGICHRIQALKTSNALAAFLANFLMDGTPGNWSRSVSSCFIVHLQPNLHGYLNDGIPNSCNAQTRVDEHELVVAGSFPGVAEPSIVELMGAKVRSR